MVGWTRLRGDSVSLERGVGNATGREVLAQGTQLLAPVARSVVSSRLRPEDRRENLQSGLWKHHMERVPGPIIHEQVRVARLLLLRPLAPLAPSVDFRLCHMYLEAISCLYQGLHVRRVIHRMGLSGVLQTRDPISDDGGHGAGQAAPKVKAIALFEMTQTIPNEV